MKWEHLYVEPAPPSLTPPTHAYRQRPTKYYKRVLTGSSKMGKVYHYVYLITFLFEQNIIFFKLAMMSTKIQKKDTIFDDSDIGCLLK